MKYTALLLLLIGPSIAFCQQKPVKATPAKTKQQSAVYEVRELEFTKAKGIEYMIVNDVPGPTAKVGDVIDINVIWKAGKNERWAPEKDSVILNSRAMNAGKPITMPLTEPTFAGDMLAAMPFLSVGDSAVIRVSVDYLKQNMNGQTLPPFAKEGEYFIYEVTLKGIKKKEQVQKEMKANAEVQKKTDEKLLQDYFKKNNINAQKTSLGVYYTVQAAGAGTNIKKGQKASFMYKGKFMDGKVFDSNEGKDAMKVTVGTLQVIPGMDDALQVLKKGAKATVYIPSHLAYGPQGKSPIPANAILIFEMDITEVN